MKTENPDISVVLCIYNGEKYLNQAIDSILGQDFQNFELLLIDDGSTDSSLDIIRQYAILDNRCKIFTGPNQGLIGSRNMGVVQANADIIALMDADDICLPHRFSTQLQYLQAHPNCVAVGSQVLLVDPENQPIAPFLIGTSHQEIYEANMGGRGGAIINPSAMIRKSAFVHVGMHSEKFLHAEDIDMFLRLGEVGKLANIPEVLLRYRQHMSSIGYQYAQTQQASAIKAVQAACKRQGVQCVIDVQTVESQKEQASLGDVFTKWAWWALGAGNIETARKYGWRALLSRPLKTSNIKLFFCLLRGH
jgi:glycosyltransferase involved in cell wall biosynthesis